MGRNARKHYDRLAAHYDMKDMGVPTTWCGIQFEFLPHKIVLHQTDYRKYFVKYWANHPKHPMRATPHLSPMNSTDLRNLGVLWTAQLAAGHRSRHHPRRNPPLAWPRARDEGA